MRGLKKAVRFAADLAIVGIPALAREATGTAGIALVGYGAWQIYQPAGYIAAGVLLIVVAALSGRSAG